MNAFKKIALTIIGVKGTEWLCRKIKSSIERIKNQAIPDELASRCDNEALEAVGKAFVAYADNFRGVYESLHSVANSSCSHETIFNVLIEWDIRINNIPNIPINMKAWWETIVDNIETLDKTLLKERAAQILEMINAAGIIRCDNPEVVYLRSRCWYMATKPIRIIEEIF